MKQTNETSSLLSRKRPMTYGQSREHQQQQPRRSGTSSSLSNSTSTNAGNHNNYKVSTNSADVAGSGEGGSGRSIGASRQTTTNSSNRLNIHPTSASSASSSVNYDHAHDGRSIESTRNLTRRGHAQRTAGGRVARLNIMWLTFLITAYTMERCTFKVAVDYAGPFRLFLAEVISGTHVMILLCIVSAPYVIRIFKKMKRKQQQYQWLRRCSRFVGRIVGWSRFNESDSGAVFIASRVGSDEYNTSSTFSPRYRILDWKALSNLSITNLGVIAILDSIQLALAAVTASHVPAMLTVTLIQLSIPLSVCFSHLSRNSRNGYDSSTENAECNINVGNNACRNVVGGDVVQSIDVSIDSASEQIRDANAHRRSLSDGRRYPASYILGVIIVSISVFVGLLPEILSVRHSSLLPLDSTMSSDVSWNSILYTASTIPLAGSTIVKEKTLSENRQPIERNQVNLVLALGQFIFVAVVSPLFYGLQGMAMGPEWLSLYPSRDITMNFIDGVSCFAGMRDKSALSTKYVERASCGWITTALILGHVLSISLVGFAVHGLVVHVQSSAESKSNTFQEGILTAPLAGPVSELNDDVGRATTVLYRGIAIGIVISVMVLSYYDIVASSNTYGTLTNIFFWSSVVLLIIGWELYHRSGLIEEAFDTEYPQLEVDDDDDE